MTRRSRHDVYAEKREAAQFKVIVIAGVFQTQTTMHGTAGGWMAELRQFRNTADRFLKHEVSCCIFTRAERDYHTVKQSIVGNKKSTIIIHA